MACELLACCRFFEDNMKNMPEAENYIKNKLCFGIYTSCNRYKIFKGHGGENIHFNFDPDSEEVKKIVQCMRQKQLNLNCEKD